MIAYLFLSASAVGTAAAVYFVAPAGRGLHRYVVPRSVLRAEAARSTAEVEELVCKLVGLSSELDTVSTARDDAQAGLDKAMLRIADLEEQLREADKVREGEHRAQGPAGQRQRYPAPAAQRQRTTTRCTADATESGAVRPRPGTDAELTPDPPAAG